LRQNQNKRVFPSDDAVFKLLYLDGSQIAMLAKYLEQKTQGLLNVTSCTPRYEICPGVIGEASIQISTTLPRQELADRLEKLAALKTTSATSSLPVASLITGASTTAAGAGAEVGAGAA
jgi:hypothetical protein